MSSNMTGAELQAFLRFLSQDAKIPLTTAIAKVKALQDINLGSIDNLAKVKFDAIVGIFEDEKLSKQVVAAAKRVTKKRSSNEDPTIPTTPTKKVRRDETLFKVKEELSPAEIEESLALPQSDSTEQELEDCVLITNRAPLVLAFVVTLLKHSMPEQPLSSRLSLAQAYVSTTSRSRAVNLGIESGKSAAEEGFGDGQPIVTIMAQELRVLKRYGYSLTSGGDAEQDDDAQDGPPLWGLDLEHLKHSEGAQPPTSATYQKHTSLPIHPPQSARAYLLKSFASTTSQSIKVEGKKSIVRNAVQEKAENLGKVLKCLDLLYNAWAPQLSPADLDSRTWNWYVKVRPDVEHGPAGWGGKNELKLSKILALRPDS